MKLCTMRISVISLIAAVSCCAQVRTLSTNFAIDIRGEVDTRQGTWGRAGAEEWKVRFFPPAGRRVQIIRVYGDVVSWPKGKSPEGSFSGILFGLQTTGPDGSVHADLAADNCFLYIQDVLESKGRRTPFDTRFDDVYLDRDSVLRVKVAAWLNDTGLDIHIEPTFSVVYQFSPVIVSRESDCRSGSTGVKQ